MNLETLGWCPYFNSAFLAQNARDSIPARVAREDRNSYVVYAGSRAVRAEVSGLFRHRALSKSDFPAVGDWVTVRPRDGGAAATIHAVLPRRSAMTRKSPGRTGESQVVAANVDSLLICCGLDGDYSPRRIERYVALAYGGGTSPIVLLTKADLCDSVDDRVAQIKAVAIGVPVWPVSVIEDLNVDRLRATLTVGHTAAFVGSSGAGKSTLINHLLRQQAMRTREVRAHDDRGRHTTTFRQMFLIPNGGVLIDTPGMRELGLTDDVADVHAAFAEIEALAANCRFRDCGHAGEPGCAVRAAIDSGALDADRLTSFEKQRREAAYFERRDDPAALAEQRAKWKAIHKSARKWMKDKYRM